MLHFFKWSKGVAILMAISSDRLNLIRITCAKHRFVICGLFFFVYFSLMPPVFAGDSFDSKISSFVKSIVNKNVNGKAIYIGDVVDASLDGIYLPFSNQIHSAFLHSFKSQDFRVVSSPEDADLYVFPYYNRKPHALLLRLHIEDLKGNEVSSGSVVIPFHLLPESWDKRSLHDVAYEIVGKLDNSLLGQKINVVFDGLSGGQSNTDKFISDFTINMDGYINEELSKLSTVSVRNKSDLETRSYQLTGRFKKVGKKIVLRYTLIKDLDKKLVAAVSTWVSIENLPQGMSLFPSNRNTVAMSFDGNEAHLHEQIPVVTWVNHENSVYSDGDQLKVSIRPEIDAYIRVFYVQSDGMVCQIQPSSPGESSLLRSGKTYVVGGDDDDVELEISNSTTGQEMIKVFASKYPINESVLKASFIDGANFSCVSGGYSDLTGRMSRGLNMVRTIKPVNEIMILVK